MRLKSGAKFEFSAGNSNKFEVNWRKFKSMREANVVGLAKKPHHPTMEPKDVIFLKFLSFVCFTMITRRDFFGRADKDCFLYILK